MIDDGGDAGRLAARRPALEARARVLGALRAWFDAEGFLEVDAPAMVRAPGQEVHLDAFRVAGPRADAGPIAATSRAGAPGPRWLHTSPEYAMKRLVGAGYDRIVSIGKCWRAEERGPHHEPEFTMIEWYRAGAPLEKIANDCEALIAIALGAAGRDASPAAVANPPPFARLTVRELLAAPPALAGGASPAGPDVRGDEDLAALKAVVAASGIAVAPDDGWDDVFFRAWLHYVEPALARIGPTFVVDWPAPLAALARRRPDAPQLAERFELYAGGLELANAFGELTDPDEQRTRFEAEREARRARGGEEYPIDEALLAALARMPATSGVALGFDRLMMYVLGKTDIREVMAFASDEV